MPEVLYNLDKETNVAMFTIDTAGPVNTIGQQFLADLEKVVNRAQQDGVKGVVFRSGKKKSFLDGANLKEMLGDATPQMIRIVLQRYQDLLAGLATSPFPVVAILDGQTALGGGFELLLWACDHVFATKGSRMGLPEVNVGLFPAGGGTQTLRRVTGFKTAVDMIIGARVSPAETYAGTGFLTLAASKDLLSGALAWLNDHQGIVNRNYDPNYQEPDPISDDEKQKTLNKTRFRYTICPERPYLAAAIEAFEAGLALPFDQAVRKEMDLFVPLLAHPNARNKIDLFFLMTSTAHRLAKVDRRAAVPVSSMAVIGAGLMGCGIAQIAADKGLKVTLIDVDEQAGKAGVQRIEQELDALVNKGRWSGERKQAVMDHFRTTTDYGVLKEIPLVIECVFEDLPLKRQILSRCLDANPNIIFASNTSTLPMAEISDGSIRPEQVVGMHFFSPVPLMPLLEVVQGPLSSPAAVSTAVQVGRAIGKTVILVGDGPGFYTSRTFGAYVMNGFRLAELGVSPWDVDLLALQAGFPQGPLHVYGTAGGTVVYHAGAFMCSRFPDRMQLPKSLAQLYEAGYVGAGKPCFYRDSKKMTRDESVLDHIVLAEGLPQPANEEVKDILLLGMANEAFHCLSDGVLRDYYSMDLGAVLGIGFPDCWHGPARYVSQKGVSWCKKRLVELCDRFQMPILAPAPEFDQIIACGLDSHLV